MCDCVSATAMANRVIACVADGCNWGSGPREAAQRATRAFVEYCQQRHASVADTQEAAQLLIAAFSHANAAISASDGDASSEDALLLSGTTTLLGSIAMRVSSQTPRQTSSPSPTSPRPSPRIVSSMSPPLVFADPPEHQPSTADKWALVCCTVGDCKAFRISAADGSVTEVTAFIRDVARDVTDPGGRLGPGNDGPDLRNMAVFYTECDEGDLVLLATDGVHDNLDPQLLGLRPRDAGASEIAETWSELDMAWANRVKIAHENRLIKSMLGPPPYSAPDLCKALGQYCDRISLPSREFMETNPNSRLPDDYTRFPGKLDHTSCICFRLETTIHVHEEQSQLPKLGFLRLGDIGASSLREARSAVSSPKVEPMPHPVSRSRSSEGLLRRRMPSPLGLPQQLSGGAAPEDMQALALDGGGGLVVNPWQRSRALSTEKGASTSKAHHPTSPSIPPPLFTSLCSPSPSPPPPIFTASVHRLVSTEPTPELVSLASSPRAKSSPKLRVSAGQASPSPAADAGEGCSRKHQQHHHHHTRPKHRSADRQRMESEDAVSPLGSSVPMQRHVHRPAPIYPAGGDEEDEAEDLPGASSSHKHSPRVKQQRDAHPPPSPPFAPTT